MVDDVQCNKCYRWGSKDGMNNHLSNPTCDDYEECEEYVKRRLKE